MDNGENYSRFLSGDKNALEDIVREYMDGLVLYLCSFTDNIVTAEEIAEDTFVKLYADRPSFRGRSTFRTWLYAIARNLTIDYMRKNSKHMTVPIDENTDISDDALSLESAYIIKEDKMTLHRAMRKLSPDHQQVLWLVYFEEMSNKEAAAVMGKSVRGLESILYRARKSLRSQLETEGFNYEKL